MGKLDTEMISIILPTFNGEKYLAQAIESVTSQTYREWELIIIDDCSTDTTSHVITPYLIDKRISYFRNETNLGLQRTLNKGILYAKGILIARLDDDDYWNDITKLERQAEYFENNPSCALVGTGMHYINEDGTLKYTHFPPLEDTLIRKQLLLKTSFIHSSVCFRKEFFDRCGGYSEKEEDRHIEDHELWLKMGLLGSLHNLPMLATTVRHRKDSVSGKNILEQQRKQMLLMKRYRKQYPGFLSSFFLAYARLAYHLIIRTS
jgi:glycosyltransferase involved in cell wall biosynthesis